MAGTLTVIGWHIPAAFDRATFDAVARRAVCVLSRDRFAVLVGGRPAVAGGQAAFRCDDSSLPVHRDAAVRCALGVSGLRRAHGLTPARRRPGRSRGPASSGRVHVGGDYVSLSCSGARVHGSRALPRTTVRMTRWRSSDRKDVRESLVDRSKHATTNTAVDIRGSGSDPVSRAVGTFRSRQYP